MSSVLAFTILGLPAHPLIVHGAVVGVPLAAFAALWYVLRPAQRDTWWILCAVTVAVAWVFTFLAGQTGESLEHALHHSALIRDHAQWADRLGLAMHIFTPVFLLSVFLDRRQPRGTISGGGNGAGMQRVLRPLSAVGAVAVLVLVMIVGHLGAKAAWHDSPAASTSMQAAAR